MLQNVQLSGALNGKNNILEENVFKKPGQGYFTSWMFCRERSGSYLDISCCKGSWDSYIGLQSFDCYEK